MMSKLADTNRVRLAAELQRRLDGGYTYPDLVRMLFAALLAGADEQNIASWLDALERQTL
jgi:hypothetical protein